MLPGKRYTVDDLLHILQRRFWVIAVPFALLGAVAAAYTRSLPDEYWSETVIMVMPQQIPENYVQGTVTARIEDRLPTLETTILSRTRLERIIEQFDLYPELRRTRPMEDVVAHMRDSISVVTATGNTFRVGYAGGDPVQVMKVTEGLASLFINESLLDRQMQAEGTNRFLDSQLAEARSKLEEQERRLAAWKVTHAGELPTQYEANIQQAQNAQMALRDLRVSMNQDQTRRLELERQLGDLQNPGLMTDMTSSSATMPSDPAAMAASGTTQQLAAAEAQVLAFEQRGLKPGHPDLDAALRRVRDLQARLRGETSSSTTPGASRSAVSATELARQRQIANLKDQISQIDKQLTKSREDERTLMTTAADAQRRADAIPTRESEYTALTRDYETLRNSYERLLSSKQQSQIAANLERRQVGEQFKLVDPAVLPVAPVSPNRPRDIVMGLVGGLLLGAALVGLLEYRDKSFKTDEDLAALLDLPVLAVVPVMKSDADVRQALWRRIFMSTALGSVVTACLAFVAYVFVRS
jgi:polysaccharide chain length determinant protein (PEP-CTERM system associated)